MDPRMTKQAKKESIVTNQKKCEIEYGQRLQHSYQPSIFIRTISCPVTIFATIEASSFRFSTISVISISSTISSVSVVTSVSIISSVSVISSVPISSFSRTLCFLNNQFGSIIGSAVQIFYSIFSVACVIKILKMKNL